MAESAKVWKAAHISIDSANPTEIDLVRHSSRHGDRSRKGMGGEAKWPKQALRSALRACLHIMECSAPMGV